MTEPIEPRTGEGAPAIEVECPTCDRHTRRLLPRSATDVSISPVPDPECERRAQDNDRYRHVRESCDRGHAFHLYFEW